VGLSVWLHLFIFVIGRLFSFLVAVQCSVLQKHAQSGIVCDRACVALTALARVPGNSRWFGPIGVCETLLVVLQRHSDDARLVQSASNAVASLCIIAHNRERLGFQGGCELLVRVCNQHARDQEAVRACVGAIWRMCEPQVVREPTAASIGVEEQSSTGSTDGSAPGESRDSDKLVAVRNAVKSAGVSPTTMTSSSVTATNRARFLTAGVSECVATVLRLHVNSAQCSLACVRCVTVLSAQLVSARELGGLGICELICAAFQTHCFVDDLNDRTDSIGYDRVSSALTLSIARWTALALQSLCVHHPPNQLLAIHAGAVSLLSRQISNERARLTREGTLSSSLSLSLTALVTAVTAIVSDNLTAQRSSNAENLPLTLLSLAESLSATRDGERELQSLVMRALLSLCENCAENALAVAFAATAPEFLMSSLSRTVTACAAVSPTANIGNSLSFEEKEVRCIAALCVCVAKERVGQARLGGVGSCKAITPLLSRCVDRLFTAPAGSGVVGTATASQTAIMSLALQAVRLVSVLSNHCVSNQDKLGQFGVIRPLTQLIVKVCSSLSNSLAQIQSMKTDKESETVSVLNSSTTTGREKLSERLIEDSVLIVDSLQALHFLCADNEQNRQRVLPTAVVDNITEIVSLLSNQNEQTDLLVWSKKTLDVLIGTTQF
jgi:hypothetical protein